MKVYIDRKCFKVLRIRYTVRPAAVPADACHGSPRAWHAPCSATAQLELPRLGCPAPTAGLAGHVARAFRRCSWSPTGHFSGGAHPQLFREHGDPPFSRRIGQSAPAAYRSDHILADPVRWVTPDLSRRHKCWGDGVQVATVCKYAPSWRRGLR